MKETANNIDFAFLDSGTGGIPYMLALHSQMPLATCVYLGDTEHFPYGEKTLEQVTECASSAIRTIISRWNPKEIVIACNTISVTALEQLRKLFPELPIVGTVPAIKLAAAVTKNRRIGLLATNATVNHPYCQKLIEDFASDCTVIKRGDPALIDFIEHRYFAASKEERLEAVKDAADFFLKNDCDTVILGCTHFTHIDEEMKKACGKGVSVIDSREGVAKQAVRKLGIGRVSEAKTNACVWSESKDGALESPAVQGTATPGNLTFYVTKASLSEEEEYKSLCKNMNIPWGGILK